MSDQAVVWKPNLDNNWRLFNHSDFKLQLIDQPKDSQPAKESKPQQYSPFSFTKLKPMTKGSMVCTNKGYGLVQSFNEDRKTISVKIEGQIFEMAEEEVMNEVPLNVVFINNSLKTEEVLYVPMTATINELVDKLEASLMSSENAVSISLFFEGKELEVSPDTVEKLKIMPGSKLLGLVQPKKPLTHSRYNVYYPEWHLNSGNLLGLSFSASKTIRVIGFGLLKTTKGTMSAEATMCSGSSIKGEIIGTKSITVGMAADVKEVEKVMFGRPYTLKAGEFITIFLTISAQCTSNYGAGAKAQAEAEGDITFTFKMPSDLPCHLNSTDDGQFPEIYYYV